MAAIFILGLVGGYGIQPKLKHLHLQMYAVNTKPEVKETARKAFRLWHGLSWAVNLVALGGITVGGSSQPYQPELRMRMAPMAADAAPPPPVAVDRLPM